MAFAFLLRTTVACLFLVIFWGTLPRSGISAYDARAGIVNWDLSIRLRLKTNLGRKGPGILVRYNAPSRGLAASWSLYGWGAGLQTTPDLFVYQDPLLRKHYIKRRESWSNKRSNIVVEDGEMAIVKDFLNGIVATFYRDRLVSVRSKDGYYELSYDSGSVVFKTEGNLPLTEMKFGSQAVSVGEGVNILELRSKEGLLDEIVGERLQLRFSYYEGNLSAIENSAGEIIDHFQWVRTPSDFLERGVDADFLLIKDSRFEYTYFLWRDGYGFRCSGKSTGVSEFAISTINGLVYETSQ
jgi:hypothetical protein